MFRVRIAKGFAVLEITGKVKWFDTRKRYGYIAADDGNGDVFLHHSDIADETSQEFEPGQAVRFETSMTPYGRRALRVRPETPASGQT